MNAPTILTLPSGLRVVYLHVPKASVGYAGVAVRAGSRDELTPDEFGTAHFVEHTIFKGTKRRSSWHIINRMEAVGGELNAFTTKEHTVFYSAFPRPYLGRALELIGDLIVNSRFPENEIEREREVIDDEIKSYLDSPSEAVFDDFEDEMYAGTGLGHNILGTVDSVARISSNDCRNWLDRYYTTGNVVAFYAGAVGVDTFVRHIERHLGDLPAGVSDRPQIIASATPPPFRISRNVDTHQAHVVMGTRMASMSDDRRLEMALLTNILGGPGMNSQLNVALRERRGLVYSVESSLTAWTDTTMFTTYFGTDHDDVDKCIGLVNTIVGKLAQDGLNPRSLAAAKKQYLGQLVLGRENIENRIQGLARAVLNGQPIMSADEVARKIEEVSAEALRHAAEKLTEPSILVMLPKK